MFILNNHNTRKLFIFGIKPRRLLVAGLDKRSQTTWSFPSDLPLKAALGESVTGATSGQIYKKWNWLANLHDKIPKQILLLLINSRSLTWFIVPGFKRFNKRQRIDPSFKISCRKLSNSWSAAFCRCSKRPKATNQLSIWRGFRRILYKFCRSVVRNLHCGENSAEQNKFYPTECQGSSNSLSVGWNDIPR